MNTFNSPQTFIVYLAISFLISFGFRWLALKRIESFSIDIVIFTTLYCFVNIAIDKSHLNVWLFKAAFDLIFLLLLVILHSSSYERLHRKISDDIDTLKNINDPDNVTKLDSLKRTIELAVEVSYSKYKWGKAERRREIRKSIRDLGFDSKNLLDDKKDETFFLPKPVYRYYLTAFGFITFAVIVITLLPYSVV